MAPNLFTFASSELSQDAILAWIISWGDSQFCGYPMHEVGTSLIQFLCSGAGKPIEQKISTVLAGTQSRKDDCGAKGIDVWAKINGNILLAIEDKIGTSEHNGQLERYRTLAKDWCDMNNYQPIFVFLKTEPQSTKTNSDVEKKNFKVFDRNQIIDVLGPYRTRSEILRDYVEHLELGQRLENSFRDSPVKQWSYDSWSGLYKFLDTKLQDFSWEYVPNKDGGFNGAWWHKRVCGGHEFYLQIEQGDLCIKIGKVETDRSLTRNKFFQRAQSFIHNKPMYRHLTKPDRFGTGYTMTVLRVEPENWIGEKFDEETVLNNLKLYEDFLTNILDAAASLP